MTAPLLSELVRQYLDWRVQEANRRWLAESMARLDRTDDDATVKYPNYQFNAGGGF